MVFECILISDKSWIPEADNEQVENLIPLRYVVLNSTTRKGLLGAEVVDNQFQAAWDIEPLHCIGQAYLPSTSLLSPVMLRLHVVPL